jgi:hypothetical protein
MNPEVDQPRNTPNYMKMKAGWGFLGGICNAMANRSGADGGIRHRWQIDCLTRSGWRVANRNRRVAGATLSFSESGCNNAAPGLK